jgi:Holliday junction DNA helicase RuvA
MIAKLTGKVAHLDIKFLILDVNGIGYKVFATSETLEKAGEIGADLSLWIHHTIREDASDLFGFPTRDSLGLFELLIGVSGIGPKTGLNILNLTTPDTIREAVETGDISYLTKISGIGKKMAEKMVIELRDKLGAPDEKYISGSLKDGALAIEALQSLGYSEREAREAVKKLDKDITSTQEMVKSALKILSN